VTRERQEILVCRVFLVPRVKEASLDLRVDLACRETKEGMV
jgi:hypothetical protein